MAVVVNVFAMVAVVNKLCLVVVVVQEEKGSCANTFLASLYKEHSHVQMGINGESPMEQRILLSDVLDIDVICTEICDIQA